MELPRGLVQSLGDKGPSSEGSESTDDESMAEQHIRSFFRFGNAGKFKQAADSFKAAMDECMGAENESPAEDAGEPGESDEY
jgi:hypothetical protein